MKDCIFCKIGNGKIPVERIYENGNFFSILDANPKTEGHTLIISKKHFDNLLELPTLLGSDLLNCIKETSIILMKKYRAEGFNVVNNNFEAGGQIVKHVHFHILPRKKGDREINLA
jgi:histidine triad (HIT) family protein